MLERKKEGRKEAWREGEREEGKEGKEEGKEGKEKGQEGRE